MNHFWIQFSPLARSIHNFTERFHQCAVHSTQPEPEWRRGIDPILNIVISSPFPSKNLLKSKSINMSIMIWVSMRLQCQSGAKSCPCISCALSVYVCLSALRHDHRRTKRRNEKMEKCHFRKWMMEKRSNRPIKLKPWRNGSSRFHFWVTKWIRAFHFSHEHVCMCEYMCGSRNIHKFHHRAIQWYGIALALIFYFYQFVSFWETNHW